MFKRYEPPKIESRFGTRLESLSLAQLMTLEDELKNKKEFYIKHIYDKTALLNVPGYISSEPDEADKLAKEREKDQEKLIAVNKQLEKVLERIKKINNNAKEKNI